MDFLGSGVVVFSSRGFFSRRLELICRVLQGLIGGVCLRRGSCGNKHRNLKDWESRWNGKDGGGDV